MTWSLLSCFDCRSLRIRCLANRGDVARGNRLIAIHCGRAASRGVGCFGRWNRNRSFRRGRAAGNNGAASGCATRGRAAAGAAVRFAAESAVANAAAASAVTQAVAIAAAVVTVHVAAVRILRVARPEMVDAGRSEIAATDLIDLRSSSHFLPDVRVGRLMRCRRPVHWFCCDEACARECHSNCHGDQSLTLQLPLHVESLLRRQTESLGCILNHKTVETVQQPIYPTAARLLEAMPAWGAHYCRLPQACNAKEKRQTKWPLFGTSDTPRVPLGPILRNVRTFGR